MPIDEDNYLEEEEDIYGQKHQNINQTFTIWNFTNLPNNFIESDINNSKSSFPKKKFEF